MRTLLQFTLACGLLLSLSACKREKLLDLTEGVILNVNTDILNSPLTVTFVNSNPGSGPINTNILIDVFGEDADKLYSPTGEGNLTVVDGMVDIALKKSEKPTPEDPITFGIVAKANGFLPSTYFFSVTDATAHQFATIALIKQSAAPEGVTFTKEVEMSGPAGLAQALNAETPLPADKEEKLTVEIPQGTTLYDANGIAVTGNIQLEVTHFDNRSTLAREALGGVVDAAPARGLQGEALGLVSFDYAGVYVMEVKNGDDTQVSSFSGAVPVTMTLNPETFNPKTSQYIQPGDLLDVWSFDETSMHWQLEFSTPVVEEGGKLLVSYNQPHLSTWLVGNAFSTCGVGTLLTIQSNIPEEACPRYYYCELIDVNTGLPIAGKWSNSYQLLNNNKTIQLTQVPSGVVAKMRVWEGVRGCTGAMLVESQPFDLCGAPVTLDFSALNDNNWYPISVDVSGYCEAAGPDLSIAPTGVLLYRPTGCGNYGFLGMVTNGVGCTATLERGARYDFKTRYGGQVFEFFNLLMDDTDIIYTLDNGQEVVVVVTGGPTSADINLQDVPIPQSYCDLVGI